MKLFISFIILIAPLKIISQNYNPDYKDIDNKITQLTDSIYTNSTNEILIYINDNFTNETDKLRTIFIWISNNFEYDYENMFAINFYADSQEVIDYFIKNKKGVCMHFAELFNYMANNLKIKTYVISGYTIQKGFVDYVPHAWCASQVDSTWFLFDPTWGAGYIQNHKYVKKINNFYFKTKPEDFIKTHIPFDPLWQFLNYTISSQEFYEGNTEINIEKPFFNYVDSLKTYENETNIEKLISENRRIQKNGVKNSLIFNQLQNNAREIEYYTNLYIVDNYNFAVNSYNNGIEELNQFINYRNKQFTPIKTEDEIREMVNIAENYLLDSKNKLNEIKTKDLNTINLITHLNSSINEALNEANEQKIFIDKYFSTKKIFRKSLFYKYTWMGIPIN